MKQVYKYLIVAVLSAICTLLLRSYLSKPVEPVVIERTVTVYRDTSAHYKPLPTLEVKLPNYSYLSFYTDTLKELIINSTVDSIYIPVPITQKVYSDSTYTAYISGYNPSLDSIFVYRTTTYVKDSYKYPTHSIAPFVSANYIVNNLCFVGGLELKLPVLERVDFTFDVGYSAFKTQQWEYSPTFVAKLSVPLFKW